MPWRRSCGSTRRRAEFLVVRGWQDYPVASTRSRNAVPEQLGFEGMPERLFVCTPSKLGSFADCPRRYRYSYVDRPTPPKGPPWAHNSLGASVHSALKNWFDVPVDRRAPGALPTLLRAT